MRADGRIRNAEDLARTVVATRESVPILLGQIATVRTGQALRMGSASENGHEVVVGTAVMRIGENSRTVSTGVGNRLAEIGRALPVDVVVKPVLNRTELANSTIATVARNLAEGAVMVIVVLFVLLGNFRAALIAALVIPVTMLLPPNATDTFVILEPRAEWPDPSLAKAALVERIDKRLSTLPGNAYEITQPIQMRFNELIAGVRGDIAVKVFGDDFGGMNAAADRIAGVLRKTRGAVDVRVEQTEGLPMLDIRPNRMAMSQIGVTAGDVQDTVAPRPGGGRPA